MSTSPTPDGPSTAANDADGKPAGSTTPETAANDALPEREPLTPEEVEDEAVRGDFMLRWAVILLALLMACTEVVETGTLLHVKSGQYTLQNGLPARTGVFSSTASDRAWHNLSWLFDVVLAGVFAIGGGIGLSIFKALLAAATFWFVVHTNRKDVSTWWGTICAGLALLACFRLFTARPEIVTLLGLAVTLRMLHVWREDPQAKFPKGLVIVFLLWANLDPGMFYGLAVLVLYALGETLGEWLGYTGLESDARRRQLWLTVGACVAVTLLNPFGWNALLAPIARYTVEYPELREYSQAISNFRQAQFYPMTGDFWTWQRLGPPEIAGLILLVTAPVTFALNFRRLDFGHVTLWLGFTLLAFAALHELAAAALVSAVLATLNAEQWYQNTFRQTYSVETSELVFSRGGRAATVLAIFGLAYLTISGLLERRTGIGFNRNLQASIDGLRAQLQDSFDDRPFNFVLAQGDLLVWLDQKAFVDSRVGLYAGSGDDDILALHRQTREALRNAARPGEEGRKWKPVLDRFQVTHVLPRLDTRLAGGSADLDYRTMLGLQASRDWQPTSFGATTVVYYRRDLGSPKLAAYLKSHQYDFVSAAFRQKAKPAEPRAEWARGPNFYEKWLSRPRDFRPNPIEAARHYITLIENLPLPLGDQITMAHLAIHNANVGLTRRVPGLLGEDIVHQSAEGYWLLGRAYARLAAAETALLIQASGAERNMSNLRGRQWNVAMTTLRRRRYRQAACALQQAIVIDGKNPRIYADLAVLQRNFGKPDLSVANYERCLELHDAAGDESESARKRRNEWTTQLRDVKKLRDEALKRIKDARQKAQQSESKDENRFVHVLLAQQFGCVQFALQITDQDPEFAARAPHYALKRVDLLQQAGRMQEADEALQQLDAAIPEANRPIQLRSLWMDLEAMVALCRADYATARTAWQRAGESLVRERQQDLLLSFPLAVREPPAMAYRLAPQEPQPWSTDQTASLTRAFDHQPGPIANLLLAAALTRLESEDPQSAVGLLQQIGEIAPEAPVRILVDAYLHLTTGEGLPPLPPPGRPPVRAPKPE